MAGQFETPWATLPGEDHDFSISHDGFCDGLFEGLVCNGYKIVGDPEDDGFAVVVCDMGFPNRWNDRLLDQLGDFVAAAPDMAKALRELLAALEERRTWPANDTTADYDAMLLRVELAEAFAEAILAKIDGAA